MKHDNLYFRILLVDDRLERLKEYTNFLLHDTRVDGDPGKKVKPSIRYPMISWAQSAEEAFKCLIGAFKDGVPFDRLITDYQLADGGDGLQLIEQLQKNGFTSNDLDVSLISAEAELKSIGNRLREVSKKWFGDDTRLINNSFNKDYINSENPTERHRIEVFIEGIGLESKDFDRLKSDLEQKASEFCATANQSKVRSTHISLNQELEDSFLRSVWKGVLDWEKPHDDDRVPPLELRDFVGISEISNYSRLLTIAEAGLSILLLGPTGSGKSQLAKALHYQVSKRKKGPYKHVNCANLKGDLLNSELFGHVKGAFTGALSEKIGLFEQAHKGTLFLDEIGEMSPDTQASLLTVIDEKTIRRVGGDKEIQVDVSIISATNADLKKMIDDGRFREDLYYRLNILSFTLPPLSERRKIIPDLAKKLLEKTANDHLGTKKSFSSTALDALCNPALEWNGNIRELENVIKRTFFTCESSTIYPENLDWGEMDCNLPKDLPGVESQKKLMQQLLHCLSYASMDSIMNSTDAESTLQAITTEKLLITLIAEKAITLPLGGYSVSQICDRIKLRSSLFGNNKPSMGHITGKCDICQTLWNQLLKKTSIKQD